MSIAKIKNNVSINMNLAEEEFSRIMEERVNCHTENENFKYEEISFHIGTKQTLKITSEGFEFNGDVIKDSGEAYKVFMGFFSQASFDRERYENILGRRI